MGQCYMKNERDLRPNSEFRRRANSLAMDGLPLSAKPIGSKSIGGMVRWDWWTLRLSQQSGHEYRRFCQHFRQRITSTLTKRAIVHELLQISYTDHTLNCSCSAPPDQGLATKQMSGKKKEKFRITLRLAANADGSEKLPLFYIG